MPKLSFFILLVPLLACKTKDQSKANNQPLVDDSKEVVCFLYHRFGDSRYPSTNISLNDFEAHLNYLKTNGFQVLTLSDAVDYLRSDMEKRKTAVITIDDGFASFYQNALPLLKKFGFPATLFINTETVGGDDYMNWSEIKELQKHNVEIGNHTHSHAYFLNLPASERYSHFEKEVKLSQQLIEESTGTAPQVFAYPYGELDPGMKDVVNKFNFKAAAAQNSGVIYSSTDLMQCPRFPMSESYAALDKFAAKAEMKALRIIEKMPQSFVLPTEQSKPKLKLKFDGKGLRLEQLQCFVQGSECNMDQVQNDQGIVTLTVEATTSINKRRRTLYTITVPDDDGQWHWFSHLWINPAVD